MVFIRAASFHRHLWNKNSTTLITSLNEISHLIKDKKQAQIVGAGKDDNNLIDKLLPEDYKKFQDVFFKIKSDEILLFQSDADFKINLEDSKDLVQEIGHALLYKMSLEELKAIKKYLEINLAKEFIFSSDTLFTSPVLFIYHNGKLCFCVDYQKLNLIFKKN